MEKTFKWKPSKLYINNIPLTDEFQNKNEGDEEEVHPHDEV